jgi:hypothetical protein
MVDNDIAEHKGSRGSMVLESAVCIPLFLMAMITLLTIAHIIIAQAKISFAIDQAAAELSQYGYVYNLGSTDKVEALVESVGTTFEALKQFPCEVTAPTTFSNLFSSAEENLDDNGTVSTTGIETFLSSNFVSGNPLAIVATAIATNKLGPGAGEAVAKSVFEKHVGNPGDDGNNIEKSDAVLKSLGVVNGINGLNFAGTKLYETSSFTTGKSYSHDVGYQEWVDDPNWAARNGWSIGFDESNPGDWARSGGGAERKWGLIWYTVNSFYYHGGKCWANLSAAPDPEENCAALGGPGSKILVSKTRVETVTETTTYPRKPITIHVKYSVRPVSFFTAGVFTFEHEITTGSWIPPESAKATTSRAVTG